MRVFLEFYKTKPQISYNNFNHNLSVTKYIRPIQIFRYATNYFTFLLSQVLINPNPRQIKFNCSLQSRGLLTLKCPSDMKR